MRRFILRLFAILALWGPAQAAVIADFSDDFSGASNPNGMWEYGYVTTLGGALTQMTVTTTYGAGNEAVAWSPASAVVPLVGLNTSASTVSFLTVTIRTLPRLDAPRHLR